MISIDPETKRDPIKRWNLPDRTFFAAGACHILAHCFLEAYPNFNCRAYWIKPAPDMRGNHIFVSNGKFAFDYDGAKPLPAFIKAVEESMKEHYVNWKYDLVMLPLEVLTSTSLSRQYDGLWLREPGQFLEDPRPRAKSYLDSILPEKEVMRLLNS